MGSNGLTFFFSLKWLIEGPDIFSTSPAFSIYPENEANSFPWTIGKFQPDYIYSILYGHWYTDLKCHKFYVGQNTKLDN